MMNRTYILYHAGCYDGFGSAYAAWKVLGDSATYMPVKHGYPMPEIPDGADVYIQDFAYARDELFREIGGYPNIPTVNSAVFMLEVKARLCEQYPEAPFTAYFFDRSDGKRQWGLRANGDFDVSEVAKQLGGGGHRLDAGFTEVL